MISMVSWLWSQAHVGVGVHRGELMLGGSHLVVLGLGQHAQLPQLLIQIVHEGRHTGLDGTEVVVVQLLPLGGLGAEQRAAAEHQILPLRRYMALVDEKILLLRPHAGR